MPRTPETGVLLALEAAISAYKKYARGDALKNSRVADWQRAATDFRKQLGLPHKESDQIHLRKLRRLGRSKRML